MHTKPQRRGVRSMTEGIIIDDECEFCFMHDGDAGLCCAVKIEDMPSNCPRRNDFIDV